MKKLFALLLVVASVSLADQSYARAQVETKTVPYVDMSRYIGAWYDIASKPTSFENGCYCSRQVVQPGRAYDQFKINMSCNKNSAQGAYQHVTLNAKNVDPATNAKLRATYNVFIKIDYWVIGLAPDYSWAVLTNPSGSMLYIISKTPKLAPEKYAEAVRVASEQRDVSELRPISQDGCTYPARRRYR